MSSENTILSISPALLGLRPTRASNTSDTAKLIACIQKIVDGIKLLWVRLRKVVLGKNRENTD